MTLSSVHFIEDGSSELCALQCFPGARWFSEVMSVAIPLELKEKNPVDPGRLDFTCLCSKVDSAEQSIRDPLTGITRST